MLNDKTETVREIAAATVGADPRFAGSAHDDEAARRLGFAAALVPGPTVASFMSHLFVEAWGEAWLMRGVITERQRRPVYEGQTLIATASPIGCEADGVAADIVLRNVEGETVAMARGSLPDMPAPAPRISDYPLRAHFPAPSLVSLNGLQPGQAYRTRPFVYSDELHDEYCARVRETLAIHLDGGVAHPGYLVKLVMHDATDSYTRPTPGVHVGFSVQHYALAHVGDTLSSSGMVAAVYDRDGRRYVESEQLVVADGLRPIALVRRTGIASFATPVAEDAKAVA